MKMVMGLVHEIHLKHVLGSFSFIWIYRWICKVHCKTNQVRGRKKGWTYWPVVALPWFSQDRLSVPLIFQVNFFFFKMASFFKPQKTSIHCNTLTRRNHQIPTEQKRELRQTHWMRKCLPVCSSHHWCERSGSSSFPWLSFCKTQRNVSYLPAFPFTPHIWL